MDMEEFYRNLYEKTNQELENHHSNSKKLIEENQRLQEELKQCEYVKASVFNDREEYKNKIVKLTEENKNLESDLGYLEEEYLQLQEVYINLDRHYDKLFKDYDDLCNII